MDHQFQQNRPLMNTQPLSFHHNEQIRPVTPNTASVSGYGVHQFDQKRNLISTSQCPFTAGLRDRNGYYEGCQSSEYSGGATPYPTPIRGPQPGVSISHVSHEMRPGNFTSYTGGFNNHDIRPINQESVVLTQHICEPLLNTRTSNSSENLNMPPLSAISNVPYPHNNDLRPVEGSKLSDDFSETRHEEDVRNFLNKIGRGFIQQRCNLRNDEKIDKFSHRKTSPERTSAGKKSNDTRPRILDHFDDESFSLRSIKDGRQRKSRSPKSLRRSTSPKSCRRVISSKIRSRSPPLQKSQNTRIEVRSSKNVVAGCTNRDNSKRDRLVEWRNRGLKTDSKEKIDLTGVINKEKQVWTRSAPADLYYVPGLNFSSEMRIVNGTMKLVTLCDEFEEKLLKKAELIRANLPKYEPLHRKKKISIKKHGDCHSSNSSCSSSESEEEEDCTKEELEHKKKHPLRLHEELWFNDPGEMNDGPLCRCSAKARRSGIRHNIYAGENHLPPCDPDSNNADRLHHYRITISPATNFLVSTPTIIEHDSHEYIFEGFSMFSHKKLEELPLCKVIRFNIEYTIVYYEEPFPQNFTVRELNLFYSYLFREILELVDLDLRAAGDPDGCPQYHFMPRFVRELPGNGKEILSMNEVLRYLLHCAKPLIPKEDLTKILDMPKSEWQRFTEDVKGMIVTYPGKKPCSLRVDQLDRDQKDSSKPEFPEIVHFGIRPPQLSYAGNPEYQKAWREYVKFRHLLANMPKPSYEDKRKLESKENKLQNMRTKIELRRNVTVTVSSENFHKTGIMCDVVQHGMLIPVLVTHLRFHRSLDVLEEKIKYKFSNRYLLQLALTHPSYRENFGTNPDHARNSLTNCGIRQPVYGDRKIHYQNTRKRGINTLINIMSRFGKKQETESQITHNERLEFLGDAVVEFVTSVHLFHIFSDLEEGGLATFRAAIVQNQHLAVLAKTLRLEEFMLYAHGSDLCHDLELRHAMANCFEALMGALFLDGGIEVADKVFGEALFNNSPPLLDVWVNYPPHPLQEQEPLGDRKWIATFPWLQHLTQFEESIGVEFTHIRLLARAFTDRSMGYTNLTLGSNQRLEFLGDTVLQLIASEYLYKHFPEHHEGHLSLLRSSLVNNRTQAVVCNDLDMTKYAKYSNPKAELKTKDRADLLEAFLGALYVDQGLEFCQTFCNVCFFPRLQVFIMNQDWNDPKSKLQQCCLTLRTMEGGEPEIPVYKVIECMGPTNTRIYTVAVYFKNKRLAKASGHSIQQAEMNAAKKALKNSQGLFPQLDHQRRVISKSMNCQKRGPYQRNSPSNKKGDSSSDNKTQDKDRRSLSPEKTKTTPDDIFSQKIRSRTPPLAYQIRSRSSSPESSSEDDENPKAKGKNSEDETESDHSSHADPSVRKCGRSRSGSKTRTKSTSRSPCRQRKSKSLSEDSGYQPRRRSKDDPSLSSGEMNCSLETSKDINTSSSSRNNQNQSTRDLEVSSVLPSLSSINKEPVVTNIDESGQLQPNKSGSVSENMRYENHDRVKRNTDVSKVNLRSRSPEITNGEISKCTNVIVEVASETAAPNVTKKELSKTIHCEISPESRLPNQTLTISHVKEEEKSRSISNTKELDPLRQTRNPSCIEDAHKIQGHDLQTHTSRCPRSGYQYSSTSTILNRAKSPHQRLKSPPKQTRSPHRRSRSPSNRTSSPPKRLKTSPARAMSYLRQSQSSTISVRTVDQCPRMSIQCPSTRPRIPSIRPRSPSVQARNPAMRKGSPTSRPSKPSTCLRSPPSRPRSPSLRPRSSSSRPRSPSFRPRSPSVRAKSPSVRARSPSRTKYPPRASYRSPPRRARERSPEGDVKKKMTDFMLGKRASPGIETKSQKGASWLIDLMFDSSTPQNPQPVNSSFPSNNQAHYNSHPLNQSGTNLTHVYNQNGNCPQWPNNQHFNQQGAYGTGNYSSSSYPPPPYHY